MRRLLENGRKPEEGSRKNIEIIEIGYDCNREINEYKDEGKLRAYLRMEGH